MAQATVTTLPAGRRFERFVVGSWLWHNELVRGEAPPEPDRLGFESSIQEQIEQNWKRAALAQELGVEYLNPANPQTGQLGKLWRSVNNYLEANSGILGESPLYLYVTIGHNSLDHHYGVDLFFWWHGVIATVDISLRTSKEEMGANILLTPADLLPKGLPGFGAKVGSWLIARKVSEQHAVLRG